MPDISLLEPMVLRGVVEKFVESDLNEEQKLLFDKGCKVMLTFEKKKLAKVLARHIRGGSSKYARSIPIDGVESVTLSLSCALWVVRAS